MGRGTAIIVLVRHLYVKSRCVVVLEMVDSSWIEVDDEKCRWCPEKERIELMVCGAVLMLMLKGLGRDNKRAGKRHDI